MSHASNRTHTIRALPNTAARLLLALCAALSAACGGSGMAQAPADGPQARVLDLVEALTPLDETFTGDVKDAWFQNTVEKKAALKILPPEYGREALRYLREVGDEAIGVEVGLLEVAAHSDPEGTAPYLEELIFEYGYPMHQRAEAVTLLAEIRPERAMELFDPHLREARHHRTYPDAEFFVRGYIDAARARRADPTDLLVDVATNLWHQDAARHFAVGELGNHPSEYARQALEITLTESTGNGYLRRKAAQALRDSLPRETACQIFANVANKEADRNMLAFLIDMINENCK